MNNRDFLFVVVDRNGGTRHKGMSHETVVRRVWGRSAFLRDKPAIMGMKAADVVRRTGDDPRRLDVLAEVLLEKE